MITILISPRARFLLGKLGYPPQRWVTTDAPLGPDPYRELERLLLREVRRAAQ